MTPMQIGMIAEKKFSIKCIEYGIHIFKPIMDNNGVDFIVKTKSGFSCIQVKSTKSQDKSRPGSYKFCIKRGCDNRAYSKGDYDFLAAYIIDLNICYLIPFKEINSKTIRINPSSLKCKYKKYRESWCLIT